MLNESVSITGTDPGSSPPRTTTESLTDALHDRDGLTASACLQGRAGETSDHVDERAFGSGADRVQLGECVGGEFQGGAGDVLTQMFDGRRAGDEQDVR